MKPSRNGPGRIGAGLLLSAALAAGGCTKSNTTEQPPNIVFISIDSLRPDHLHSYGYPKATSPFIDSLAARGVRFTNAVSTTSWTLPSHASMFTGLLGSTHGLVDNGMSLSEDQVTLAELLKAQGYHTAGFFGGPYLHPTFGLDQGFDVYRSCMTTTPDELSGEQVRVSERSATPPSHRDVTGPRTLQQVSKWSTQRRERGGDDPFFLFLHMWDVHYDFNPPDVYRKMFVDPGYAGHADGRLMHNPVFRPGLAKADLDHVLALYDGEIRFTDEILRRIFADLEAKGLMQNTLVILTADHGEEFFEHGNFGHNKTLFDEVLRVPLVILWPGKIDAGQVVEDQVQVVDLMPTMARFAGFGGDLASQGRDLSPLLAGAKMGERDALSGLFIDGMSLRALRSNQRKVFRVDDSQPAVLINLREHPAEKFDAMIYPTTAHSQKSREEAEAQLVDAVRRSQAFKEMLGKRAPGSIAIPEGLRADLSSLGYLGEEAGPETEKKP